MPDGNDYKKKWVRCHPCPFYHRAQRQAAGGYWVPFACGSPTNGGGVRPGLRGVQKCPHLLNNTRLLLKTSLSTVISGCGWSSAVKLGSCIVKSPGHWTRFLLYAKSPQVCSSTNISIQAPLQTRAVAPFGFRVTWMEKKNNRILKKKKKKKKITCDVFACGRCIPSASIDVAHLLITEV